MVCDTEKLSLVLDSAPQKSINLAKCLKKLSTNWKMQACVIDLTFKIPGFNGFTVHTVILFWHHTDW
jgi:hypothetical protein